MSLLRARPVFASASRSGRSLRVVAASAVIVIGAALSGCGSSGFQPMYASSTNSPLTQKLASVNITTIPGRVGQRIRNELVFQTTGGAAQAAPKYQLDITLTEQVISTLVNQEGDSASQIYSLDAQFALVDKATSKPVLSSTSFGRAGFERYTSIFSNVRAREDAENRAATTVARDIRSQLEAFLSRS
ncbi:MAG: LPS assembly lipoprotein LptE [Pseudomonadota bacterium]